MKRRSTNNSTLAAMRAFFAITFPAALSGQTLPAGANSAEYFETEIRPILVERCQSCHGSAMAQGGLRLTSRALILKGGGRGAPIVPGKPESSLLLRAVEYKGGLKMPPTGKIPATEIEKLRGWIAMGAPWPESKSPITALANRPFRVSEAQRKWWAFQPPKPVAPPYYKTVQNPIDRFIQQELDKHGIAPTGRADKRTLIRRASFDLTGLPPSPDQVDAFLADKSDRSYERLIDRLLASPAYGEKYARHWLDVVRYADYHDGDPKARTASCEPLNAWRYRDWVVSAFNGDMPFDRFIVHQIAGDLLSVPNGQEFYADGLVATTFLTNGSWDRGDADKEKMVSDMVDDNIDAIGKAFLGLTLGCARCHDHKFDPISTNDYYGLAGMFYSTHILKDIGTKGGEYTLNRVPLVPRALVAKREQQTQQISDLNAKLAELDKRTPRPAADDPGRIALEKQRDQCQKELLPEPPVAEAAQEGGTAGGLFPNIQDVPIHIRGSYTRLGQVVSRHLPAFLAKSTPQTILHGSGRLELANWIASKDNLLTARVIVNRVWQWHFGTGLVASPNNFGMTSQPPSHPALLDWLAAKFVADGWSLKKLHRLIMLSEAYQRSSAVSRATAARDSENRWLGRFSARRLDAEELRDAMLSASGSLEIGGGGPATADLSKPCRSLYVQTARWDRGSFAMLFDAANPDASEEKRTVSTVSPQALFLLNNEFVLALAKRLAERLIREVPYDEGVRIQRAYELLFARPATTEETKVAFRLLNRARMKKPDTAWRDLCHVLVCSNEFAYLD